MLEMNFLARDRSTWLLSAVGSVGWCLNVYLPKPERKLETHRSSALGPCYFRRRGAMPLPRVKQSLFPIQMFSVAESCGMHGLVSQLCRKTLLKMLCLQGT